MNRPAIKPIYDACDPELVPNAKIRWLRGYAPPNFNAATINLILGNKGSGKSALAETLAVRHKRLVDLFGSRDDENLCWLRKNSPIDDILLVHGDNVKVDCSWDTIKASEVRTSDILSYRATVTCNSFYRNQEQRYLGLEHIIDTFWGRRDFKSSIAVTIREASSFLYSRMKLEGANMKDAKADFIYFQREMRHFGISLYIDTIRWTSIDKEMRDLADYLIIKRVGHLGLPRDLKWMYSYIKPSSISNLHPRKSLMLAFGGAFGIVTCEYPKFHKEEGVDLLRELGIKLEYTEAPEQSTAQQVGDKEHAEIIKLYHDGLSMDNVSNKIKRSKSTVQSHIRRHDSTVSNNGVCLLCQRAQSDLMGSQTRL